MNSDSSAANVQAEGGAKSPENGNQQALATLQKSDLEMVRVLDDLIYLLMRKGVIAITDLPPMAQVKLLNRANARQELGGLEQLLGGDDRIF
ncbi:MULTISPECIES: hypothetical protein [Citrobacter]|jgi:hypothetical protein|uniref:hypothetical protein n=1 Tax=Citrobacter TaxID=544 RepID=UPI00087EC522|nr:MULTISPECIES: hypothetical protein [Citrobacter]APR32204.1 hypothetical protein BTW28_15210 [Citrobacter freundii]NRF55992.1 hypothetical protein [Citrobacter braakii]MBJ9268293.1 hypothetical protein [Citrobacter freundii]MBY1058794.1 hypothetical protein [Citrobacter europaeus]MCB6779778.1 hypothetical protein [Citrobacter sp. 210820-DFI.7.8]